MSKTNQNKTVPTDADVDRFIDSISSINKQNDARTMLKIMNAITGEKAVMWGPSIIGYGSYHYIYDSGREGDMCRAGFSPRKSAMSIYCMSGFSDQSALLGKLGKYKLGKSCLYINKLSDVDEDILRSIVQADWAYMNAKYPQ